MSPSSSLPKKKMKFVNRKLTKGLGEAVAKRTILRTKKNGELETWEDVAERVARGNTLLIPSDQRKHRKEEFELMKKHIANASLLMSGRHLQHGDETQPERNMEIYTNCATASASYILFYLLLNGSGVGRAYDDDLMVTNWDNMPIIRCVLDDSHKDFVWGEHESVRDAKHKYAKGYWYEVPDTREGWAQTIEKIETMAYEKKYKDETFIIDFSQVRPRGSMIHGMQNRPASGPRPLMNAIAKLSTIKNAGMSPWRQALFIDHYLAESVLVGGARRSARIATKTWTDPEIFDFIAVKRGGFLWSANNSVAVDDKFWKQKTKHSEKVLDAVLKASYYDKTGEPGFINQHKFVQNDEGFDGYLDGKFAESAKYKPAHKTEKMLSEIARHASTKIYTQIPNPCGEITLNMLGGYCVIADVVPYFAPTVEDAEEAFRLATRALIRVNTMDCLYNREVNRTNRIGVGMTGLHEYAWNAFGYGFRDLINEKKSKDFWMTIGRFKRAVVQEAEEYSAQLGVVTPHTNTTIKPAGCRPWYALTTTNKGILTLQELFTNHKEGEQWSIMDGELQALQDDGNTKPLTRTFDNGEAEVLQIQLAYGLTVESTKNHPWFVKERVSSTNKNKTVPHNDWVTTEQIQPGDILDVKVGVYQSREHALLKTLPTFALHMRGKSNPIQQPRTMNPNLAWLLGYLWGDGAMSPSKYRLRWLDRNTENLHKANKIFQEQFGISGEIKQDPHKDARSLEIGNIELWHWLIKNDVFKYHAAVVDLIPRVIRESSQEDILAFIAGLIDADGAVGLGKTDKTVTFTQADYRFARHVQDVAWTVGLAFGMSHNTVGENWQRKRKSMYLLTMSAVTKQEVIQTLVKHSNKMASAETSVGSKRLPWRCDATPHKRRTLGKVESINSLGMMPTYDVEVSDNHWFYAGAVKSHNTTSKLFGLSEGAHLPAMREYIRWVQFMNEDPLVKKYEKLGYPTKELKSYNGTTVIGFPTQPEICKLGMNGQLVTAGEATPEEQYKWLMLLEKYWIVGVDENGEPLAEDTGNQVSYTLKYNPEKVSFAKFKEMVMKYQSQIKCCSVMPQVDVTAYEYQPEEPVTISQFMRVLHEISADDAIREDIDMETLQCATGACPI